jgi:hypothetical protein
MLVLLARRHHKKRSQRVQHAAEKVLAAAKQL